VKKETAVEQFERAREELAAAQAKANEIAPAEAEARLTAKDYAAWRASRAAVDVEIERLSALVASLEEPAERERELNAFAAIRKQHAAKVKANADLAARVRADVARANAILLSLLRDVAASALEDQRINSQLPDDLEPVVGADHLARGRPELPRKEIDKTTAWLWTRRDKLSFLIGDQDAVESHDGCSGLLRSGLSTFPCVRVPYEQRSYHPAEPMERAQPLWQMKLPRSDAPGFVFDGTRLNYPGEAIAALDHAVRPKVPGERPIEIELTPIPAVSTADSDELA
jgi:hypothetical protein